MLADVVGQPEAARYLRLTLEGKFASPLLFLGDEGIGKRFSVLQTVKELFCQGTRTNDCPCGPCFRLSKGVHPDFHLLEVKGDKDIGVEEIRGVIEATSTYPSSAPNKVFLLDGADRLTPVAANALLKTLEEPPARVLFFLLAQQQRNILPTILSRCGQVQYKLLPESYILERLQQFESDPNKALVYSRLGRGSLGRALALWGSGRLRFRDDVLSLLETRDIVRVFTTVNSLEKELPLVFQILETLVHDVYMLGVDPARLVNLDIAPKLGNLRNLNLPALLQGIRELRSTKIKVNAVFHLKTLLAQMHLGS